MTQNERLELRGKFESLIGTAKAGEPGLALLATFMDYGSDDGAMEIVFNGDLPVGMMMAANAFIGIMRQASSALAANGGRLVREHGLSLFANVLRAEMSESERESFISTLSQGAAAGMGAIPVPRKGGSKSRKRRRR